MKNKKFVALVLVPAFIHLSIFVILPIIGGFGISLFEYNPLNDVNPFVGLDNFTRLLSDKVFMKALTNTLFFVFVTVILNIVISLALAKFISMMKSNKTRSLFRVIFFLPCVAPLSAAAVVWGKSIFPTSSGLANMVLNGLGINSINWLGDPNVLMWSMILFTLWADIGYNIILFTAGMDGIPEEFYEASKIDGAGEWKRFKDITLPLLGRTFIFVTIMTLISHFQMFAQFSIMVLKNGPQNSGLVLTSYIYKVAFEMKDMGYASAIAMVLFLIIMIVTLIQQRVTKVDWEY
ncbi:carbohydrate ABC transporter permease [Anaerorhabdus sp.]|uniref:carbohydrate ABC transporter permease n=1 Tax=Anaerorhabdus sp. TaxID=1872524 RepID=UPI002FC87E3C